MPVSRRDRKVDLTKVGKKASRKKEQIDKVRRFVESFDKAYVINFLNPRNQKLAEFRREISDGQVIFGKNKITMIALGKKSNSAFRPEMDKLTAHLKGQCALFLTNLGVQELRDKFNTLRSSEFARSGITSPQEVTLVAGPMPKFAHTMEPYLRQLGLSVKLIRGVVHLEKDFLVCKQEDTLTPEQCRILKLIDHQLSEFRVGIVASWSEEAGVCKVEEEDSYAAITSLPPAVRVTCQKLDDGQYYFVPEAVEPQEAEEKMADE